MEKLKQYLTTQFQLQPHRDVEEFAIEMIEAHKENLRQAHLRIDQLIAVDDIVKLLNLVELKCKVLKGKIERESRLDTRKGLYD
jgi:hypothetical protein